ncbi:MAG: hypothetical protein COA47_06345 [Robiginitomaculum sp.]|nr:MAG: hypothetical protein COA47_06345 [Robiginitomaculum sp.]
MTQHRGVFWMLLFSLALNLLIVGGFAGLAIAKKQMPQPSSVMQNNSGPPLNAGIRSFDGRRFFQALPASEKRRARRVMSSHKREHRQHVTRVRKAKQQVYQLLKSDPMNVAAVETALHELRQAEVAESGFGQMIILGILKDMEPQARIRVIEKMTRPVAKRPPPVR